MVTIDIHDVIASETHSWYYEMFGYKGVFSLETINKIFADNQTKKDFHFNFHCDGGEVSEGLAIYDAMRRSGKRIHCNVEGKCHSMAVTLLLAAPAENRTANPNAQFLIHEVQGGAMGSTSEMEAAVDEQRKLQDAILDIYADRTGRDRAELEAIMKEQKTHTAREMMDLGFISSLNQYNTNLKTNMNIIERMRNLLTECEQEQNTAEPANVQASAAELSEQLESVNALLKVTQEANDTLASANTELNARIAEQEQTIADLNAAIEGLNVSIEGLNADKQALTDGNADKDATIEGLNAQIAELNDRLTKSNYMPAERTSNGRSTERTAEDIKAEVREKLNR